MEIPSSLVSLIPVRVRPGRWDECWDFTNACARTNIDAYRQGGQGNLDVIKGQILHGKNAEWAVYDIFRESGLNPTKPDMRILPAGSKDFSADITCMGFNEKIKEHKIHVKAQPIDTCLQNGISVTFQKSGARRDREIFDKAHRFLTGDQAALCLSSEEMVWVWSILPVSQLFDCNLFEEPMMEHLKEEKKAVYHGTLLSTFSAFPDKENPRWYFATQVPKLNSLIQYFPK